MDWLKNLIKKIFGKKNPQVEPTQPAKPIPEIPTKDEEVNFPKKKIALIIGHGNGDGGANTWNGSNEFNYNSFVAEAVKRKSKHLVKTFYRGDSGIIGVALSAVSWRPDVCIELHLNSYNGKAKGCEVLVLKGDKKSAELAREFAWKFTSKFGRVLRGDQGVKWLSSGDRGAASLKAVAPIDRSILIEPFFCDNKEDWLEPEKLEAFLIEFIDGL